MTITLTTLGSCGVAMAAKLAALVEADGGVELHFDARHHERRDHPTLTISQARQLVEDVGQILDIGAAAWAPRGRAPSLIASGTRGLSACCEQSDDGGRGTVGDRRAPQPPGRHARSVVISGASERIGAALFGISGLIKAPSRGFHLACALRRRAAGRGVGGPVSVATPAATALWIPRLHPG